MLTDAGRPVNHRRLQPQPRRVPGRHALPSHGDDGHPEDDGPARGGSLTSEPEYHEFSPEHLDEVVRTMAAMAEAHEGWINFEPSVHVEDVPPAGSGVFSLFSARGPAIPLGTWTPPPAPRRGRPQPAMIGLQHGMAAKVKGRLAELGHPVPDGWVVVQDYAKKGLVAAVPAGADHAEVVRWLLRAAALLCAVPLTGWRMAVYGRPG